MFQFVRTFVWTWMRVFYRVTTTGRENIPQEGAAIVCANHTFYKDLFLLGGLTKRRIRWFAKSELFRNRIFGRFLTTLGAFPVHRGESDRNAVRMVYDVLKNGEMLGIFPEGTRVRDIENRTEVKRGFLSFAYTAQVPIIPVTVSYENGPFGRGRVFSRIRVIVGESILLDFNKKYPGRELTVISNNIMNQIYNEMNPK